MKIAIIVAVADNGVIGNNGTLPWQLSDDLKWFKQHTTGKPVVMGRSTFESIGRVLPNRPNIVLTRRADFSPDGVTTTHTFRGAVQLAAKAAHALEAREIMIIGGSQVYTEALPQTNRIYLTRVHGHFTGDTYFPVLDKDHWTLVSEVKHPVDTDHPVPFTFQILERSGAMNSLRAENVC